MARSYCWLHLSLGERHRPRSARPFADKYAEATLRLCRPRDPGEGFRSSEGPYPLTPALSPWEREQDGLAADMRVHQCT
jgi:hypothetical protein